MIVSRAGETVVDREYQVRDLLGPVLQHVVQQIDPDEQVWGFCLDHPTLGDWRSGARPPRWKAP